MFCMNYPEQSVKLAQRRQEIISILNDPRFREQFLLSRGKRDWEQFISFVSRNFPIIDKLIETVKEKELTPIREENERLKLVMEGYRKKTLNRDLEIIRLYYAGWSQNRIAGTVRMSPKGVKKAKIRLGLITTWVFGTKSHLWSDNVGSNLGGYIMLLAHKQIWLTCKYPILLVLLNRKWLITQFKALYKAIRRLTVNSVYICWEKNFKMGIVLSPISAFFLRSIVS